MLNLSELEQFVTFAEQGTLSGAAQTLHISQPTLTRTMKHVEAAFGVPLFRRSKNKIELNETGLQAVQQAKNLLSAAAGAVQQVHSYHARLHTIATGCLAAPFIRELVDKAKERCPAVQGTVYAVVNHYFGETIDVAGLVTATDLMTQLKGQPLGERLLLPANMLRHGGDIFLDDYRVSDVERALGVPVRIAETDGFSLVDAIFELEY